MSDSLNEEDAPKGTSTKTEDDMGVNGSIVVEAHATSGGALGVMGDIGNPPIVNLPQVSAMNSVVEKAEETNKEPSSVVPANPSSTSPTPHPILFVPPADDMETKRTRSPTPPPPIYNNSYHDDGESVEGDHDSSVESSPVPMKRAFVLSGREHEDTDDFLLSTMLAIRTAVLAGTRDATKIAAAPEDFCASRKHRISMAGDRKVEVKDYAPVVFTLIRRFFGVSIPSYLLSWSDSRLAKSKSAGKSDSMFIHSPDNKFVLKTLAREEAKRLCKILRPYYEHMIANKDTFMSRIYGLHRMSRRRGQSDIYFAIFNNVFDSGHPLSEIYDLKGSTIGRRASCEQPAQRRSSTSFEFRQVRKAIAEEQMQPKKPTVLKDLDFTRKLHVGPENREKVLAQLSRDCKFLAQHQLMDYSLLIGVRRTETPNGTTLGPSDSPTLSRHSHATPISSPDQRVVAIEDGIPLFAPASPRSRHSFVVPSSIPSAHRERVPGLLFFLESTKAASSKSLRETKRDRRKSLSEGAGNALLRQAAIDAEDADDKQAEEASKPTDYDHSIEPTPTHTPQGTPPKTSSIIPYEPSTTTTTTSTTTETHHNTTTTETQPNGVTTETTASVPKSMITVEPADDDETEGTPPEINVIPPPSPIVSRNGGRSGKGGGSGNSGEVGHGVVPILKVAQIDKATSSPKPLPNGNGTTQHDPNQSHEYDSDDSSIMDSQSDSPRRSLGILTVSSVPHFNYFAAHPPPGGPLPKSGSGSLRMTSPGTPPLMKRNKRSASLSYVNLDPLCGNPHVPFYKNYDGGLSGATFVPLDTNKSNEVYYIGLIDFLQKYNKKKKLAGFAKSLKYEKEELSTVDPVFYMERFLKMTEKAIVE